MRCRCGTVFRRALGRQRRCKRASAWRRFHSTWWWPALPGWQSLMCQYPLQGRSSFSQTPSTSSWLHSACRQVCRCWSAHSISWCKTSKHIRAQLIDARACLSACLPTWDHSLILCTAHCCTVGYTVSLTLTGADNTATAAVGRPQRPCGAGPWIRRDSHLQASAAEVRARARLLMVRGQPVCC